jgi:hypothetical protein
MQALQKRVNPPEAGKPGLSFCQCLSIKPLSHDIYTFVCVRLCSSRELSEQVANRPFLIGSKVSLFPFNGEFDFGLFDRYILNG